MPDINNIDQIYTDKGIVDLWLHLVQDANNARKIHPIAEATNLLLIYLERFAPTGFNEKAFRLMAENFEAARRIRPTR